MPQPESNLDTNEPKAGLKGRTSIASSSSATLTSNLANEARNMRAAPRATPPPQRKTPAIREPLGSKKPPSKLNGSKSAPKVAPLGVNPPLINRTSAEYQRAQLRDRFFSAAPEMLCVMDGDGRLNHLNPAWRRVLGYRAADLLGKPLIHFVCPEDRRATMSWMRKLRRGTESVSFEHRFLDSGGNPRWLQWSASWSEIEGTYFAAVRDVSEQHAAIDSMANRNSRSGREHQNFLMELGPKLRQEMSTLVTATEALMEETRGGPLDLELSHLRRRGRRLNRLLGDLVDLSTIDAGRLNIELEMVDLQRLVQEVALAQAKLGPESVVLDFELPDRLLRLRADAKRLKQALFHLVENAMQCTRSGSVVIRVITDPKTGRPERIDVVDNGPGIAAETLIELLAPKKYNSSSTDQRGLGLSLCESLLPLMNFRLAGASVQGRGTTFSILLHARADWPSHLPPTYFNTNEGPILHQAPPVRFGEPAIPLKLWLINQDEDGARYIQSQLVDFGYEVHMAKSGAELQRLTGPRPDVILLDLNTEFGSGWEVLPDLRDDGLLMDVPIFALSPSPDNKAMNFLGHVDFLEEPTDRDEMRDLISRLHLGDNPTILVVGKQKALRQVVSGHLEEMGAESRLAGSVPEAKQVLDTAPPPNLVLLDLTTFTEEAAAFIKQLRRSPQTRHIPLTLICPDKDDTWVRNILAKGSISLEWKGTHKEAIHKSLQIAAGTP